MVKELVTIWIFVLVLIIIGPVSTAGLIALAAGWTIGDGVYYASMRYARYWKERDSQKQETPSA